MKVLVLVCALVSTCSARRRSNLGTNENMEGNELAICSTDPMTGWVRDGTCKLYRNDYGTHTTCAELTWEFLNYSKSQGNDLMTPRSWVSDFSHFNQSRRKRHFFSVFPMGKLLFVSVFPEKLLQSLKFFVSLFAKWKIYLFIFSGSFFSTEIGFLK